MSQVGTGADEDTHVEHANAMAEETVLFLVLTHHKAVILYSHHLVLVKQ